MKKEVRIPLIVIAAFTLVRIGPSFSSNPVDFHSGILSADDASFESELAALDREWILVYFHAPWCAPCRRMTPSVNDLAANTNGALPVISVNLDEAPRTAATYGVNATPTILLLRHGFLFDRYAGPLPTPVLENWIESRIGKDTIHP